ncbi:hypothetical protein GE09DRAFT_1128657 [Coniochaeta sp. 2T2.1]|nr:hypothetical protein GE09DRAFT_1128657 [Coniochaeta sp. 2T2.1]
MAAKRKHDETMLGDLWLSQETSQSPPSNALHVERTAAMGYPRRRVAVACEVCRLRRTRCDGAKPSCWFCTDIGVECQYRLPGGRSRPTEVSPSEAIRRLEEKIAQLEEKTTSATQDTGGTGGIHASPHSQLSSHNHVSPFQVETISPGSRDDNQHQVSYGHDRISFASSSPPDPDLAPRRTRGDAAIAQPSLLTFHCPPGVRADSWDDTEVFYDDEMAAGEQLHTQMQESQLRPLDLSRKTTRYLQQSFVENFLRWMPICDISECVSHVNEAYAVDFAQTSPSSCFAMLLFAIGIISEGKVQDLVGRLPGLDYLARGHIMLNGMSHRARDLTVLQCRVLLASYYQFAIRPLQAWNVISQASRDCMLILSSSIPRKMDAHRKEVLHRIFWACCIIFTELEAVMKVHPIGLRKFHDTIPLPLSPNDGADSYYFLAQASLSNLFMETLDVVGYQSGQVIWAPVVAGELRNQIKEWYSHLPLVIRFPSDTTPLFDPRKAFLRIQYLAMFVLINWPSVLQVLEAGETTTSSLGSMLESEMMQQSVKRCLKSCALVVGAAEETLARRGLGSQLTLWASYTSLTSLILCYNSPALAFVPETRDDHPIRSGYEMLRTWDHLPVIRRGLERTRTMMLNAGIPVNDAPYE